MRSRKLCWLHLIFIMMLLNPTVYAQNSSNHNLYLRNGTIIPPANISNLPTGASSLKNAETGRIVIIQFNAIPDEHSVESLNDAGVELLDYVPENAYTAMTAGNEIVVHGIVKNEWIRSSGVVTSVLSQALISPVVVPYPLNQVDEPLCENAPGA